MRMLLLSKHEENTSLLGKTLIQIERKTNRVSCRVIGMLITNYSRNLVKGQAGRDYIRYFRGHLNDEYLKISERAARIPLPFHTAYLCESGFSRCVSTKTIKANEMPTPDMRI